MAGKHYGVGTNTYAPITGTLPPEYPGSKTDKAYAEGRAAPVNVNPHPSGTPEFLAYLNGFGRQAQVAAEIQTGIAAI